MPNDDAMAHSEDSAEAERSLFVQYFETGLARFGMDLSYAVLEGQTLPRILYQTTSFVRTHTCSLGGFASRQDAADRPIQVIPDTSDGFEDTSGVPQELLGAEVLRRAHQGYLHFQRVPVNGNSLQVTALPVFQHNGSSLAIAFARSDRFQGTDLEIINAARNFAKPLIDRLARRSFAPMSEPASIMQEAVDWVRHAQANYDEELERQNCIALAVEHIYSLTPFMDVSANMQDAITLLQIVARNAEDIVLSRKQLSILERALLHFQDFNLDSAVVDQHWREFFKAGVDVDLPLRGNGHFEDAHNGKT